MNTLLRPSHALTEGAIGTTLLLFSLPILAGNVLQSLNGSVNAIWVGHYLGEAALTATSNANLVMFFLLSLVLGIGMATSILVGQSIGAHDLEQAKRVVGTSASAYAAISVALALVGILLSPQLLALMRTPPDALPYAVAYLRIIFLAIPFMFAYAFVMMTLRGAGDAKTPFLFLLLSVGLDIALNPLLIFGFGPIPRLGIAGSALATLIANVVSLAAILGYLYSRQHFLCLHRSERGYLRIDRTILRALLGKGLPMGLQMIVMSSSMLAMISLVNRFGSQTTAAFGATMQVWTYIQMPAFAIGMAASAMAAQNVGAGCWDRVHRTALAGVACNLLLTGTLVTIVYLFNHGAFALFLPNDTGALAIARHINAIAVWAFLFFGVALVLLSVARAAGAVLVPLAILFFAMWLVRIPFALALLPHWQADAIWWSYPLGSAISMLLAIAYYRWGDWRHARMLGPPPASAAEVVRTDG